VSSRTRAFHFRWSCRSRFVTKISCSIAGYRIDLLVRSDLITEIKSVETLLPIHQAQILTYMRLSKVSLGLLINFNVTKLQNGLKRFVL
jgi:GxxExxY protein